VAMEVCCGAHHLCRALRGQGHEVRLMSSNRRGTTITTRKRSPRRPRGRRCGLSH
jgi:hypothetical protein